LLLPSVKLSEKGVRKSVGHARNSLLDVKAAVAFFLKILSCTFLSMRSSAILIKLDRLFVKVVSVFSE
jgi:hypothetical protein